MKLSDEQRQRVTAWILEGAKLAEIQHRLATEFGVKLTYMEARFLVDDLKLVPKDPEPPKVVEPPAAAKPTAPTVAATAPQEIVDAEIPAPADAANVAVTVDQITRPGALISGEVTFSDGQIANWYLDQSGRLGVVPKVQGYKPAAADVQEFQLALQREVQKLGYA